MLGITTTVRSWRGVWPAGTALVLLAALAISVSASAQAQPDHISVWRAMYIDGTLDLPWGTRCWLRVEKSRLLLLTDSGVQYVVPPDRVSEIFHDVTTEIRVSNWYAAIKGENRQIQGDTLFELAMAGPGVSLLLPRTSRDHYVTLLWQTDEDLQDAVLFVNKKEYRQILAHLGSVTGSTPHDLQAQREKIQRELARTKGSPPALTLDRPVWLSGEKLPAGRYQIVLRPLGANRGQLFFFSPGRWRGRRLRTIARAEISPASESPGARPVEYSPAEAVPTVSAIRSGGMLVKVVPGWKVLNYGKTTWHQGFLSVPFAPSARLADDLLVGYVDFGESTAFRFPVRHGHDDCRGFLYVLRDRIIYDPVYTPQYQSHAFNEPRELIQEVGSPMTISFPGQAHSFRPLLKLQDQKEFDQFFHLVMSYFDSLEEEFQRALKHFP